ncbi:hypothetical protein N9I19_04865 [Peribacillus sp. CSMR9]|nr:hypothetical protein [Peribacillus sp. CSMR9]
MIGEERAAGKVRLGENPAGASQEKRLSGAEINIQIVQAIKKM